MLLNPVIVLAKAAALTRLEPASLRAFAEGCGAGVAELGDVVLVDASALERGLRGRGEVAAAEAIAEWRRPPVVAPPKEALSTASVPAELVGAVAPVNIELALDAAAQEHDGALSLPLWWAWCERNGLRRISKEAVCHALGVGTWKDALAAVGARRGVRTAADVSEARATLERFVAADVGLRLDDYARWAHETGARWLNGQRLARATGFERWTPALEACGAVGSGGAAEDRT